MKMWAEINWEFCNGEFQEPNLQSVKQISTF